ncbi:ParB/RepB/Spo0J family partition protein [Christensenellaceae bacterium OttesenSCG-928-K19]|nr:ParB/RepB/Spo0J family partition protein [Christensenellaceae bacterium OttesenSCG-928-K19]
MAKNNALNMKLPSVDDLFSTEETRADDSREKVIDIPLRELYDYPRHTFQVRMDANMMETIESVKRVGVLMPGLARPRQGGGYEIIAGHRRKKACELAERPTMPYIVREMTDDEADIIMVDSNIQRDDLLPSEKAFSYKLKMEALNRQGQRTDLTSTPVVSKLRTNEKVALDSGESREQIRRYIRLTELIPDILQMVDDSKMAFRPAVEISYLTEELQQELLDEMKLADCTPSLSQAQRLKKAAQDGKLDRNGIALVLSEEKPQQREVLKLPPEKLDKYFSKTATPRQKEEHIFKALDYYDRHLKKVRQQGAR